MRRVRLLVTSSREGERLNPRRALLVAAVGTFMATLDSSIVNISLPAIARELSATLVATQWVQLAYSLGVTSLLLVAGRLADLAGRRTVYTAGLLVFTAASLLCAAAAGVGALIAARGLQAVGAAMLMANGPAIVAGAFEPGQRGRALAAVAVAVSLGLTLGNSIGGLLTDVFGWRSIFLVNLPIGLGAAFAAWRVLGPLDGARPAGDRGRSPGGRPAGPHAFDLPGAAASGLGLGALLLAVSRGEAWGWTSPRVLALLAAAGWLAAAFVRRERRVPDPLLDLGLFRNPTFRSANLAALLTFTATMSVNFLLPFYLVTILGRSPTEAGLIFLAGPLMLSLTAPVGGRLADRVGSRGPTVAGLTCIVAGLLALSRLGEGAGTGDVLWRLALVGIGQGLFQTPNNNALLSSVPRHRLGIASGLQAVMRNLGIASGIALAGALVAARGASLQDASLLRGYALALDVAAAVAAAALVLCALRTDAGKRGAGHGAA